MVYRGEGLTGALLDFVGGSTSHPNVENKTVRESQKLGFQNQIVAPVPVM